MTTVYAAFNSHEAVAGAVEQLQLFGFSKSAIRSESDVGFRDPPAALKREPGIISAVENFFAKLGNARDPLPRGLYEQTIRRGGVVLAVGADTAIEEQTARTILSKAGAIDASSYSDEHSTSESTTAAQTSPDIEASDRRVAVGGLLVHKCSNPADGAPATQPLKSSPDPGLLLGGVASEADFDTFHSGSYEVRQQVEVIRVTKVARVVEELAVHKSVTVYTETITDTLRGTAVEVEQLSANPRLPAQS